MRNDSALALFETSVVCLAKTKTIKNIFANKQIWNKIYILDNKNLNVVVATNWNKLKL